MPRIYKPLPKYCFAIPYNKPSQSGLVIVGLDSEIYEITKLPETEKTDFKVGDKIIVKNGWRGFKVYEDREKKTDVFCIDFQSIIAILE